MTAPQTEGPPEKEVGQPTDIGSTNPVVRAVERAVDRLDVTRGYMERDLTEGRNDIRDLRDRMTRIETKVTDLPTKVWIGGALVTGISVVVALISLVFKLITGH